MEGVNGAHGSKGPRLTYKFNHVTRDGKEGKKESEPGEIREKRFISVLISTAQIVKRKNLCLGKLWVEGLEIGTYKNPA